MKLSDASAQLQMVVHVRQSPHLAPTGALSGWRFLFAFQITHECPLWVACRRRVRSGRCQDFQLCHSGRTGAGDAEQATHCLTQWVLSFFPFRSNSYSSLPYLTRFFILFLFFLQSLVKIPLGMPIAVWKNNLILKIT